LRHKDNLKCSELVDDQLDLRGLLDWQIGWLFALENAAGVDAGLTERLRKTASVAQQATGPRRTPDTGRS
jgi:hypothetical protein